MLVATMPAERQVLSRSNDALIRLEWNVTARLRTKIALGQTEVDDVDAVTRGVGASDQEVVGLDVAMDDPLFVHLLNAVDLS